MPSYTEKLSALNLSQKILLLSGENSWATPGIPEAGIPPLKVTDGPVGARGASLTAGASACFPAGVSAGAMWNPDLVAEMGRALAAEAKLKGAYVLLGPMINLQRTPIGGRNFECFSEDPHLTAELAIAYVNALQAEGIGACPKHYVGNDTEYRRHDISSNIDDATLHDVYLHPFERLVKEANPWTIMAAYNAVNGVSMCSHKPLNIDLLKDEWGYDGLVISDWRAAKDTVDCVKGGLDLEMPGPSDVWGDKLHSAIENGDVSESDLDDKITRYLRLLDRVQPKPELVPETGVDKPEDRSLIRRAAAEAMVLLKNDDQILPLDPTKVKKLAIIGPNAAVGQTMGGGSATVNSHPPVHPLAGLTTAFPDSDIIHSVGCTSYRFVPTFEEGSIATPQGVPFFLKEEFETDDFSGEPILSPWPNVGIALLMGKNGDHGDSGTKSMRLTGNYTPTHSGLRQLGLVSIGRSRMMVDDELVVDNWDNWTQGTTLFGYGSEEARADYTFEVGRTYKITIEYTHAPERGIQILRFGINTPLDDDPIAKAAQAAADADEAILILGSHADWESEGCDRENMELPGHQ
ncbi:MAG: glycoside hydrolase family 3 N-terminal domain-containing protein, partial [Pseudomonadota bacterium]